MIGCSWKDKNCFISAEGRVFLGADAFAQAKQAGCVQDSGVISYEVCGRIKGEISASSRTRGSCRCSANITIKGIEAEAHAKVKADIKAEASVDAAVSGRAGVISANGNVHGKVKAQAKVRGKASGRAKVGLGGVNAAGQASAKVVAHVIAKAKGNANLVVGNETFAKVHGKAFAGAQAHATAHAHGEVALGGNSTFKLGGYAGASAGAGLVADVSGKVEGICGFKFHGVVQVQAGAVIGATGGLALEKLSCHLTFVQSLGLKVVLGLDQKSQSGRQCMLPRSKNFRHNPDQTRWIVKNAGGESADAKLAVALLNDKSARRQHRAFHVESS